MKAQTQRLAPAFFLRAWIWLIVEMSALTAYPLGSKILHGRVSLEDFEQALGSSWHLLCTETLVAAERRGWAGGQFWNLLRSWERLENKTGKGKHLTTEPPHEASDACSSTALDRDITEEGS